MCRLINVEGVMGWKNIICNHCSKDWFRQDTSQVTIFVEMAGWGVSCLHVLKVSHHRLLSSNKEKNSKLKNGENKSNLTWRSRLMSSIRGIYTSCVLVYDTLRRIPYHSCIYQLERHNLSLIMRTLEPNPN